MNVTLEDLYAELPSIECRWLCARVCGPIMSEVREALTAGAAHRVLALDGRPVAVWEHDRKGRCVLLRNGLCTNHDLRPAICRLWGVVEAMPCLWGCVPERMLTDDEGREFLGRVRAACV